MRNSMIAVGVLAAMTLVAGCSEAVSGSPQPAANAGAHGSSAKSKPPRATVSPNGGASASAAPGSGGDAKGACALLAASQVGSALRASGVHASPATPRKTKVGTYSGCDYKDGKGEVASLMKIVYTTQKVTPELAVKGGKEECTTATDLPGVGEAAFTCPSAKHDNVLVAISAQRVGPNVVMLSLMGPKQAGATELGDLLRTATIKALTH